MNDRISAAPPVQFLGPEHVSNLEKQFHPENVNANAPLEKTETGASHKRGKPRPMSASAQLQGNDGGNAGADANNNNHTAGGGSGGGKTFFGRVMDVFGFGRRNKIQTQQQQQQPETIVEKRTSLQQMPSLSRDISIKSQSQTQTQTQTHIANLHSGLCVGSLPADRPSRDEILQSYNQLMATGFFQAHAIQSTRQPAPGTSLPAGLPTPSRHQAPLPRSFVDGTAVPDSPASAATFFATSTVPSQNASRESLRYPLRGRKRGRGIDANGYENMADSASTWQHPVAVLGTKPSSRKLAKTAPTNCAMLTSDAVVKTLPPTSDGKSFIPGLAKEKAIRMRSPSPAVPTMGDSRNIRPPPSSGTGSGSGANRLRKRVSKSRSPRRRRSSNSNNLSPGRRGARRTSSRDKLKQWDIMDVHGIIFENANRRDRGRGVDVAADKERGTVLQEGGGIPEPLSVVPDANRGIPNVPKIPDLYKRGSATSWFDENGDAMDIDWP